MFPWEDGHTHRRDLSKVLRVAKDQREHCRAGKCHLSTFFLSLVRILAVPEVKMNQCCSNQWKKNTGYLFLPKAPSSKVVYCTQREEQHGCRMFCSLLALRESWGWWHHMAHL